MRKYLRNPLLLQEKTASYFKSAGISNLTKKHYNIRLTKDYTYGLQKIKVIDDKDLRLIFSARPTFVNGKSVDGSGKFSNGFVNAYTIEIQFVDAIKYAEEFDVDLETLSVLDKQELKTCWKKIVDKCDLKFHSNDPSFYLQGFWEDLAANKSAIYPFKGPKGSGTWSVRHSNSGGLMNAQFRVTKHIAQILIDLDDYQPSILKYISIHL